MASSKTDEYTELANKDNVVFEYHLPPVTVIKRVKPTTVFSFKSPHVIFNLFLKL